MRATGGVKGSTLSRSMSRRRLYGGILALLAAVAVALLPLPPTADAHAAQSDETAVTKSGQRGKYDDFSDLKVTVHQTKNLGKQGVRVTWSGGAPTDPYNKANFLQIMQCWGDDESGPRREQCEFGATTNQQGNGGLNWYLREIGTDPGETEYVREPKPGVQPFVPFKPANGKPATTDRTDDSYFNPLDTNEKPYVRTGADGTGEATFELKAVPEADYLGCGLALGGGKARSCWLVVVPRGAHDADGTPVTLSNGYDSSPLSATNWASRIEYKLDFQPVGSFCPIGAAELPTMGSELGEEAMASWNRKLCAQVGNFGFNPTGEEYARGEAAGADVSAPVMSYTVEPARPEGEGAPELVHAPATVSGLAIAFLIEDPGSSVVQELRLTPRLVAKLLTASYINDTALEAGDPKYLKGNWWSWGKDPEFTEVNPQLKGWTKRVSQLESVIVSLQDSDVTRMLWHWLQSDKDAREFLSGTPDPWGMKVNPYYKDLGLDKDGTLAGFPKVDPFTRLANAQYPQSTIGITNVQPPANNLHDAALAALRGDSGRKTIWEPGVPGKLTNGGGQRAGERAQIAIVDTATAARYGLKTAALRNADGAFVQPTPEALLEGVAAMKPSGVAGVLSPDPGAARAGAYPLTAVTYSVGSVGMAAKDRTAYAKLIRYTTGAGQTPGLDPGELPPGYAPLPANLRDQAKAAADRLERGAPPSGDPGGDASGGGSGGGGPAGVSGAGGAESSGGDTGGSAGAGTSGGGSAGPAGAGEHAATEGSSGHTTGGERDSDTKQNVAKSGGLTPSAVLGLIRWTLLAALVIGGAAALSGPLLMRFGHRIPLASSRK
ncbi:hypothetical protein [Streptomyces milbemycinicus]|uniref:hypothetical protein n=1 Tax=Streptomyces milbemycinicus TaxID=476552 RepID=UPI0033F0A2E8